MTDLVIEVLTPDQLDDALADLGVILHGCVAYGASVSFIQPFSVKDSEGFWAGKVFPKVRQGNVMLFVARRGDQIVGTVQLDVDMPPNQAHRCEVAKLLVHPDHRKQGIATDLMERLEDEALSLGKSLITLDTRSSDNAEPLYIMLDYKIAGRIPNFAKAPDSERLDSTTYMYKILDTALPRSRRDHIG